MLASLSAILIYLAIFACIPALIGIYVYRDAKNRGMNAALWTLIAVLTPVLVGFIIYLLVRGSYFDMQCPNCGTAVMEQYISCPNCGTRLRAVCPDCSFPVETEWKVCPRCARPLPEHYDDIFLPVEKKDKILGKILIAAILIPVLLLVLMVFSFSAYSTSSAGGTSASVQNVPQP